MTHILVKPAPGHENEDHVNASDNENADSLSLEKIAVTEKVSTDVGEQLIQKLPKKKVRIITPIEEMFLTKATREELEFRRLPPSLRVKREITEKKVERPVEKKKTKNKKEKHTKSKAKKDKKERQTTEMKETSTDEMSMTIACQRKRPGCFAFIGAWFERRMDRKKQSKTKAETTSPQKFGDFYDIFAAGGDTLKTEL